jgi:hypothetical protein
MIRVKLELGVMKIASFLRWIGTARLGDWMEGRRQFERGNAGPFMSREEVGRDSEQREQKANGNMGSSK